MYSISNLKEKMERTPSKVTLPKKKYLDLCLKISDKVNIVIFKDDEIEYNETSIKSKFQDTILSQEYTGYAATHHYWFSLQIEDIDKYQDNPILFILRRGIHQYFDLPLVTIDDIFSEIKRKIFVIYRKKLTLIPINKIWPMLVYCINREAIRLRTCSINDDFESRDWLRVAHENFNRSYGLYSNSIVAYMAFVDHFKIDSSVHFHSANINANILLSQLPSFLGFAYKYSYIDKLDFMFRYIGETYSSLLLCCLHFTNPIEITESDFVGDFIQHMVDLSMYRPDYIVTKSYHNKKLVINARSIAQFELKHNVTVDSDFTIVLEKIVKSFDMALSHLQKVKDSTILDLRRKISAFITICYNLYRLTIGELKLQDCIVNITGLMLSTSLVDSLINSINSIIHSSIAQSGAEISTCVIFKLIGLAAFVVFANAIPDTKTMKNLITQLDKIPKAMTGITTIWKHFDSLMDSIWPWIQVNVLRQEGRYIPKVISEDVLQWVDEVTELLELSKRKEARSDLKIVRRCGSVYQKGIKLIRECTAQKLDRKNIDMISKLLPAAKILMDDAYKSGADKMCLRQEPLMVWFTGTSGVGKTGLTYPFLIDMMRVDGPVKTNYTSNIYARQAETEYWDAYVDQEYIIIDDAFQAKDTVVRPNPELFEIIRMGNMFPDHLHMASLEEKNCTYFNGKCVVLSSNLEKIQCESLNCEVAIARRINLAFRVSTKEEFRKYYIDDNGRECFMLDNTKARSACGKAINLDAYEFEQFDPVSNKTIKSGLSYQDVVKQGQEYYHNNIIGYRNMSEFLSEYIKDTETAVERENRLAFEALSFETSEAQFMDSTVEYVKYKFNYSNAQINYSYFKCKQYFKNLFFKDRYIRFDGFKPEVVEETAFDRFTNYAKELKMYLLDEKQRRELYIKERFSPYWDVMTYAFGAVATTFVIYTMYKLGGMAKEKLFLPDYVKTEKKMLHIMEKANKCVQGECNECKKCKLTFNKDKQIKWFTSCECYADAMEELSTEFNLFAVSAYNHKTQTLKKIADLHPDIIIKIVEQMLNCDCKNCKTCQDEGLLDKFSNACAVYQCPCVCVVARLTQGFALVEILSLVKYVGDLNRGIIKNEFLKHMYFKMSSDVAYFEESEDYRNLELTINQIKYTPGPIMNKNINVRYQDKLIDNQIKYNQELTHRNNNLKIRYQNLMPDFQRKAPSEDLNADTIVNCVVYPNLVVMRGKKNGVWSTLGCVLFVKGRIALMPYHYIVAIKDLGYETVQLYSYSKLMCEVPVGALKWERFNNIEKDAVLVEFPVIVNDFKDIIRHFVEVKDYSRVKGCPAILARYTYDNETAVKSPIYLESIGVAERERCDEIIVKGSDTIVISREYYSYNACTRGGDCGSTLVVMNAAVQGKILGIHNSGTPSLNHGNSVAINKEMLTDCLKKFKSLGQYAYESTPIEAPLDALCESGSFGLHRVVDQKIASSSKTALAHSCLYGEFIESPNEPAKLRPFKNKDNILIDPVVLQRKKYGVPRPYLSQSLVDSIVTGIKGQYYISNKNTPDYYRVPLTLEESIVGIDGDPFINSLNRMTSPGYPFMFERGNRPGKTFWFGDSMEFDLSNKNFQNLKIKISNMQRSILDNKRPEVIWVDTLKDARIPKEKAQAGKTRLFSAAPLDYVIALRQIALPFIAHLSNNRLDNSIAVGINPSSPEWTLLANRLLSKGEAVVAGDYSNFDGTLPAQLVLGAVEIMVDWYKLHWDTVVDKQRNVIDGRVLDWEQFRDYSIKLYYECVHHTHITNYENGALMYYVRNGIPSGCPVTAILNSIVNRLGLCYIWHKVFEATPLANVKDFIDHTADIYYGDDFIMNISKRVVDKFNQVTMTQALKQFLDMDMTDELKSKDGVAPFRNLSEVSFLKRKFIFTETIMEYTAPLEITVILDSINWVRIGNELPELITLSILESALRELALHPQDVDDRYRERIEACGLALASKIHGQSFVAESRYSTLYKVKNNLWSSQLEF